MIDQTLIIAILVPVLAALIGRAIWSWLVSSRKEADALIAQDYKNKDFERSIAELKDGLKDYRQKHDDLVKDRNITKEILIDGIGKLGNKFDLLSQKFDHLFEDHTKRFETIEKKIQL